MFGTAISPYLFFWLAAEEVEEQAERHDPVDRDQVAATRLDVAAGMGSGVDMTSAIRTTAAVTLGAHGTVQVSTAEQAAGAAAAGREAGRAAVYRRHRRHRVAGGAGAGRLDRLHGRWPEGLGRRVLQVRSYYAIIAASMLVGVAMDFVGVGPIRALYLAAIVNGVAAPPCCC